MLWALALLLPLLRPAQGYVPEDATRYADGLVLPEFGTNIPPNPAYSLANFTGQWALQLYIGNKNSPTYGDDNADPSMPGSAGMWKRHICNGTTSTINGTWPANPGDGNPWPTWGAPCNRLPHPDKKLAAQGKTVLVQQDAGWLVKIRFQRRNPAVPLNYYRMTQGWTPSYIVARLSIANMTARDRGWRKKNGLYPKYGQHTRYSQKNFTTAQNAVFTASPTFTLDVLAANNPAGAAWYEAVFDFDTYDEVSAWVMYPEVLVMCTKPTGGDDTCQADRAWQNFRGRRNAAGLPNPASAITFEADAEMGITTPMIIAASICSAVSVAIFIAYFLADNWYYARHGKPLLFIKERKL